MHNYFLGLRNIFNFRGRTSRKEFVHYIIAQLLIATTLLIILFIKVMDASPAIPNDSFQVTFATFALLNFIFFPAVIARRLHDLDRSGWWSLLSITFLFSFISLVLYITTPFGGLIDKAPKLNGSITLDNPPTLDGSIATETGEIIQSPNQPNPIISRLSPIFYASNFIALFVLIGGLSVLFNEKKEEVVQEKVEPPRMG